MVQDSIQRDKAYRQLRSLLLHGGLQPGSRLGEAEWSKRLDVHRGALRETFVLLAHEGLLEPGARGGYFVPVWTSEDRHDVLELRLALELGAIRRLSRAEAPVQTEPLEAMCQAMRQTAELDMPLGFAEADRKFHEALVELAGNRRMIQAYQHSPLLIIFSDHIDPTGRREVMDSTLHEHERLCTLLKDEQFDDAAALLEQHLIAASETLPPLMRATSR